MDLESVLSNDWSALSALLDEALALPAAERDAWLQALGDAHAVHRDTLRALLATQAEVETGDFLVDLPALPRADPGPAHTPPAAGHLVGAYRLIEPIGHGGMGTVWLAERADGVMKRRVALKLPHAVWGDAFTERLAREREILAALEHPHIARLYDAGVDVHGRPFLAMAYVAGKSIDVHCRDHALPLQARVELLLQVMSAVAHAHARLVVHRDLKPNNILVGDDGQVVLLDFGIAKLLDGERTRETALTALSGRALTLDYASPEQIRGEPLGAASDVYSLAVVAYELLAGGRPYRLKRGSAAELEEAIAGTEPPRASDMATDVPLQRQLRGDLDAILNKALKKSVADRYATMDAFADDLRRWRNGEPVQARPDAAGYRAAKFIKRHRLQLAAGTLIAAALLAGTAVALWQAREAKRAAATAQAVQGFIESVFNANSRNQTDPEAARATPARELLDRGAERIERELASAPEAQLQLYNLLARMYGGMALYERVVALERRSLALATRLHGARSADALTSAAHIGSSLYELGQRDEALSTLLQADEIARGRRTDDDHARMLIDSGLASVYLNADVSKGLARARRAAAIARSLGATADDGIEALVVLSEQARTSGHLEEARLALADAAKWIEQQGITGMLPNVLSPLGEVQNALGQFEAANATLSRAITLAERAGDPMTLHIARAKLSFFQYENRLLREALDSAGPEAAWARSLGREHAFGDLPAVVMINYGRTLVAYGDVERGMAALDEGRALLPPAATNRQSPLLSARADALVLLGRLDEAGVDVERALALVIQAGGDRYIESVRAVRRRYWVAAGRAQEALQDFKAHPQKAGETDTASARLRRQAEEATLLLATGDHAAAHHVATEALAALDRLPERRFLRDAEARLNAVLGDALLREDRAADALPVLQKALALHLAAYDPEHSPATAKVRVALAEAERRAAR